MTYLYDNQQETGLKIIRECVANSFIKQGITWDQTNMLHASSGGTRTVGSDYYQNTMIWAVPAAIKKQSLNDQYQENGFVSRIIKAGSE